MCVCVCVCVCVCWFLVSSFFVKFHITPTGYLMLSPSLYNDFNYLIDCWEDKGVHSFLKGISPKVSVIRRLEFTIMSQSCLVASTPRRHSSMCTHTHTHTHTHTYIYIYCIAGINPILTTTNETLYSNFNSCQSLYFCLRMSEGF